MAKKTKKEQNTDVSEKDIIARQKVEQLLADVNVVSKSESVEEPVEDAIVTKEQSKSKKWLEEQINELTERNEQLEKELQDAKDSFKKLSADFVAFRKKSPASASNGELEKKIVALFTKFENAYLGKNPTRERFTHVKLVNPPNNTGVLDEFIKAFGDIIKKK
jgi:predicted RNase H-like nuclease (RuvC/YqgF family)